MFAYLSIAAVFVIGYLCIALEHPLKIDKAASAILTAVICWTILMLGAEQIFAGAAESGHGVSAEFTLESALVLLDALARAAQPQA